jgi:hypothetical protein
MSDTIVFPDLLGDLRVWLINHPLLSPLTGGRVFFRIPNSKTPPTAPFMRIYRSGGGLDPMEDTPMDYPRVSHEIWGVANTDYQNLRSVEAALKSAYYHGQGAQLNPDGTTVMLSGAVVTSIDAPDPDLGWPRIIVDALLTVRIG